jgi:hypothetical protein
MDSVARSEGSVGTDAPTLHWIASITVSWALAGGAATGVLIGGLVVTSRLHSMGMIALVVIIALFGSLLGTIHGAVLGYLGRPNTYSHLSWQRWLQVAAFATGACILAVVFAVWLVVSAMASVAGQVSAMFGLALSTLIAFGFFAWATLIGWRALETAYQRWPEKRLGTRLVIGSAVVLLGFMLMLRGSIPGTEIRLSAGAAIVLTAIAALWLVSPAVIVALRLARRSTSRF